MLRLSRPLSAIARRQLVSRPLATNLQVSQPLKTTRTEQQLIKHQSRSYADRSDGILSSDPDFKPEVPQQGVIKPTVSHPAVPIIPAPPSQATPATPTSTTIIPPQNVPKTPPTPPVTIKAAPSTPASSSPSPPLPPVTQAPATPKRFRKLRVLFYLAILSALGYGGAVAYALRDDNFHDFFTEYIPFGEDAVLYFEERAFHKKFPNARSNVYRAQTTATTDDKKVVIPPRSGLSWKEVPNSKAPDVSSTGKHMSAVDSTTKEEVKQQPDNQTTKAKAATVESVKKSATKEKESSKPAPAKAKPVSKPVQKDANPTDSKSTSTDSRPPLIAPIAAISAVSVPNGDEVVVQDLVKIVNDIITVVNADGPDVANRYSMPLQKAKDAAVATASKISTLREAERAAAEARINEAHSEFDKGARQLLAKIETAQQEDEARYREEFEAERAKIADQYEKKLKAEIERTRQVWEQKVKNELAEQSMKLQQQFIDDMQGLVENEREGRLSKLIDLSSNVNNLTQLTSNWNGIIDANLATQKLQVAVDAVKAAIDDANLSHKPTPFVREMAALKLVADNDAVVDAAIASINPQAYQKGIPSSAQLIDRFRRVASQVRKASLLPENAGIASHAASFVLSKVMFKKQGIPEGSDVESILTRTETLLEEGDLDNAAREMNELKGWAGVLSKDWLKDARKVLEVKQALDVIETEARLQCLRVE